MKKIFAILACTFYLTGCHDAQLVTRAKIIIDSDYNTMGGDGQLDVLAAQLQAQGALL
jgi:purine nucleosidase